MLRAAVVFVLCLMALNERTYAETRIALIIGNGDYQSIGRLPNPPADARLMAKTLKTVGFDVTLLEDAGQDIMKRKIADFGRSLRRAGPDAVGLFYFAGHGVQSDGQNYLIPTGADIRDEADLDIFSIEADWVLHQMASNGGGTNIVILDACRNNPFESSFRSAGRGLARMGAPNGSFVAYATAPGDIAYDGQGKNSPYTTALSRAILDPGKPIEQVFKSVRIDVLSETGGAQTPWDSSSLTRDFLFTPALPIQPKIESQSGPSDDEVALWDRVRDSGDVEQIRLYLSLYPGGAYIEDAQRLASDLNEASSRERERINSDTKIAAVQPTTQVPVSPNTKAESVTVKFSIDQTGPGGVCAPIGLNSSVEIPLDGVPIQSAGSNVRGFELSAERSGVGAVITIRVADDRSRVSRPIEVEIASLATGKSYTEHSTVRLGCGAASVYLDVVE